MCREVFRELPMKSECVPFQQIPHTSKLFLDYLSYNPAIRGLYPRSPIFSEWIKDESKMIRYDFSRRERVAEILERQNRKWGASAKTQANIERFKQGAVVAVTGQQVGLLGGPLFSIFKALTAVKLAEQATASGVDCVPIFWLATEDHDLAEINHLSLLFKTGLEKVSAETSGVLDAPVGAIKFGPEITAVVDRAASLLGDSDVVVWLREAYRPGESFGSAFALLFSRLFAEFGVILLDPADKDFHDLAKPLLRSAVERASELDDALLERGKELSAAGYHQQVKVTSATTLLFEIKDGARTVVRRSNGIANGEFVVGNEKVSDRELMNSIDAHPEKFNANALFRPVVQDYLLPTLVYTGGAAEIAYFAQAAVIYEKLLGRVTPILPRFSATLLEAKAERVLTRYGLTLAEIFRAPEEVREMIAGRSLPRDLQEKFSEAYLGVEKYMTAVRESIGKLDSTLIASADRARVRMWYQINQLHRRASRAELLRDEVIARHADTLSQALFPNRSLQEREVGGISFVARYGTQLLSDLYPHINPDCHDHRLIVV
jgi:bacillithiol biosynthesis cysteine-adding enzyme BshC